MLNCTPPITLPAIAYKKTYDAPDSDFVSASVEPAETNGFPQAQASAQIQIKRAENRCQLPALGLPN